MKKRSNEISTICCAVLVLGATACQNQRADQAARDGSAASTSTRSPEDSIGVLEQVWANAIRMRDSATLDHLLAPDFVLASANAKLPPASRSEWMQNTLHQLRVDSVRMDSLRVAMHGDTAVATMRFFWAGQFIQTPFRDSTRNMDTWIHNDGAWRVRARAVIPLANASMADNGLSQLFPGFTAPTRAIHDPPG